VVGGGYVTYLVHSFASLLICSFVARSFAHLLVERAFVRSSVCLLIRLPSHLLVCVRLFVRSASAERSLDAHAVVVSRGCIAYLDHWFARLHVCALARLLYSLV